MTRFSKTVLLMGISMLSLTSLNACASEKGPGAIGTKDDIIVRNHGIPGAVQDAPADTAAMGESVEGTPPAVEAAAQAMEAGNAPLGTAAATPVDDNAVPTTESAADSLPIDDVAPQDRVRDQTVAVPTQAEMAPVPEAQTMASPAPVSAPEPASAPAPSPVYPAGDYPAESAAVPTPAPAPVAAAPEPAPMPVPARPSPAIAAPTASSGAYPLDPNAPYSPSAVAAANAGTSRATAAPTDANVMPSAEASKTGIAVPANIIAAKSALKAKGLCNGPQDGAMDAGFLNALTLYQGMNNLQQGGLNAETLRHLGIAE